MENGYLLYSFLSFPLSMPLRVCLIGGVEKYEDKKWWEDGKVGG